MQAPTKTQAHEAVVWLPLMWVETRIRDYRHHVAVVGHGPLVNIGGVGMARPYAVACDGAGGRRCFQPPRTRQQGIDDATDGFHEEATRQPSLPLDCTGGAKNECTAEHGCQKIDGAARRGRRADSNKGMLSGVTATTFVATPSVCRARHRPYM